MISVLDTGIYNTIQDQGRFGFAQMGVPVSGSLDAYAAELGNTLLNNTRNDALIEITFGLGKFQFLATIVFCLTGADFSPKLNGNPLELNQLYRANPRDILSFGKRNYGARTYLAVQGGIQSEMVLNSRSFSNGITKVRLEKRDKLKTLKEQKSLKAKYSRVKAHEQHFNSDILACYPGPEFDQLNTKQKQQLTEAFTISVDNNRVGFRLNEVIKNNLQSIITSAVIPGTIQLTPSGKLIILMNDCQVSGGYPRVLQLSNYAIARLSQKMAGEKVRFVIQS